MSHTTEHRIGEALLTQELVDLIIMVACAFSKDDHVASLAFGLLDELCGHQCR